MTAREITDILCACHWSPVKHILVPNVNTQWESDLLVLHPSDWCDEVEIKITKSDFRRDFTVKSEKHRTLLEGVPKYRWTSRGYDPDWSQVEPHTIRRYWMAMPSDLAESVLAEAPDYVGVLAITKTGQSLWSGRCKVLRNPKVLKMARKLTSAEKERLLFKAYVRYWHLRRESPGQLVL